MAWIICVFAATWANVNYWKPFWYLFFENCSNYNMFVVCYLFCCTPRCCGGECGCVWHKQCFVYFQGLMAYLYKSLLHLNQAPAGMLFSPSLPTFAHTVLDLFGEYSPAQVSTLVLCSSLLREYATDRVLAIMKQQLSTRYGVDHDAVTYMGTNSRYGVDHGAVTYMGTNNR